MNVLKKGMYVRFEGKIRKIKDISDGYIEFDAEFADHWEEMTNAMEVERFIKDYKPEVGLDLLVLIREGDYVNGCRVHRIRNCLTIILDNEENISWIMPDGIKTIVTKEQFEETTYVVGE